MTPTNRKKIVVAHSIRPDAPLHEVETNRALARWLAHILGLKYGGSYNPEQHSGRDLYLLPTQTLVGAAQARQLGVKGPEDLWGGYVDHDFICTKAISHGLLNKAAVAPEGWSPLFTERIRNVVLDGLSVHALEDARPAATHLLYSGPIRLKPVHACAGRGQEVIRSLDDQGIQTRKPLEIAVWTNEEGARFTPAMLGSAVFTGSLALDKALRTHRDPVQRIADHCKIFPTSFRNHKPLALAIEQLDAERRLQRLDLMAYGALRDTQFFGRSCEALAPRCGLEGLEAIERW